jgi:hypothetical protein
MDEDSKNVSRRRALRVLGLGGVVIATVALPTKWTRPLVETIVVPAHAAASPKTTTPPTTQGPPSDIRLKRDIEPVGRLDNGLTLYRFRYRWSDEVFVGVMAQEVLSIEPDAVIVGEDGFYRVDYARLGIRMMEWDAWVASRVDEVALANATWRTSVQTRPVPARAPL